MSMLPDPDGTVSAALQEGLALALMAEDDGDWKPVVDWFARNAPLANELARFLAAQQGIKPLMAPLRVTASPTAVGKYELREVLGKGAMGVVYRAFDPDVKREVAVKLLHPGDELSADDRARFRFEAEAVGGLNHPNVVPVLESGEADGVPYLVMALLTGGSLDKWLKGRGPDRRLAPKHAAEIARDIARGIHHAHQQGLIHRDLKPANILRDDAGGVRVADFGLARLSDATATKMAGTPAYMAPEQVGGGKRLTTAVDVHAVGAVLFELLTGGVPFSGDVGSVLRKVADEPAPAVRTYRPDVPRDLEAVVAKCLEKKPEDRYPSAAALADDLDNFVHGRPVVAAPPSVLTDIGRALNFSLPPQPLYSWRTFLFGGISAGVCFGALQAAVMLNAPRWVEWVCLAYYLITWAGMLWWANVIRRNRMRPMEREYTACHVGMMLGATALAAISMWLHDGDFKPALPAFLVVVGLGTFAGGNLFSGKLYREGVVFMLVGVLMVFLPSRYWPGIYGLIMAAMMLWYVVVLYRHGRDEHPSES